MQRKVTKRNVKQPTLTVCKESERFAAAQGNLLKRIVRQHIATQHVEATEHSKAEQRNAANGNTTHQSASQRFLGTSKRQVQSFDTILNSQVQRE